jgi:hypothetical protein
LSNPTIENSLKGKSASSASDIVSSWKSLNNYYFKNENFWGPKQELTSKNLFSSN